MSTKVSIDGDGQEIVVLEYGLSAAGLADFTASRYKAAGSFRRHVLTIRILIPWATILFAVPLALWRDLRGFDLALFIALLVVVVVVVALRVPKMQIARVRKNVLKLFSKAPSALAGRRLTI